MNICILGCGPAGLLAAHAATLKGHEPTIFSVKQKSEMAGAQYLHSAIPQVCDEEKPDGEVEYVKIGSQREYAKKVYRDPDAPCSWSEFEEGKYEIWSLGKMYEKLWRRFAHRIINQSVGIAKLEMLLKDFSLVISSIPAHQICKEPTHTFPSAPIWIDRKKINRESNIVIYNGLEEDHWYRASFLFGTISIETTIAIDGWAYGHKPISTDCDCWHDETERNRFFRVGRFGKWRKGVLVHQAFWDSIRQIDQCVGRGQGALL